MEKLTKEEILETVDRFLNEYGMYYKFIDFIKSNGFKPEEFGMEDED